MNMSLLPCVIDDHLLLIAIDIENKMGILSIKYLVIFFMFIFPVGFAINGTLNINN